MPRRPDTTNPDRKESQGTRLRRTASRKDLRAEGRPKRANMPRESGAAGHAARVASNASGRAADGATRMVTESLPASSARAPLTPAHQQVVAAAGDAQVVPLA